MSPRASSERDGRLPASGSGSACLVCGSPLHSWFARSGRHYLRCRSCGFLAVPEGLATDGSGRSIYESDEASVFEVDGNDGYYFDHETNLANCRRKLDFVRAHLAPGSRLLDAGANFGHFLKAAGEHYRASGFELSPAAVAWSRDHFGVDSQVGSIYSPPAAGAPWDGISCWDVIEHLAEPTEALVAMRSLLRPGGWLFVSTPDAGSLVARGLGRRWHYLDPVQHISVFSASNLATLMRRTGFEVVRMRALGHSYRVRYVMDRLCYLNCRGALGAALRVARVLARPVAGLSVYLQLRDVVVAVARRKD